MTAAIYNFTIEQGATFTRVFTVKDENGDLVDLTGATAVLKARKNTAGSALIDLSVGSGITLGGTVGTVTVTLTSAQTAALTEPEMIYDLRVDFASTSERIAEGRIKLSFQVSY